jgi:hypothetical protein
MWRPVDWVYFRRNKKGEVVAVVMIERQKQSGAWLFDCAV